MLPWRTNTTSRKSFLLASTALVTGVFAGATADPPSAQAACNVFAAGLVICGTTTTTNTTFPANVPNDRNYVFNVPTFTAAVTSGALVDGFGLRFQNTSPTGSITVTNDGAVTTAQPGFSALVILASGGSLTYTGTGSVSNTAGCGCEAIEAHNTGGNGSNTINM